MSAFINWITRKNGFRLFGRTFVLGLISLATAIAGLGDNWDLISRFLPDQLLPWVSGAIGIALILVKLHEQQQEKRKA
jgi:hypothetical protein